VPGSAQIRILRRRIRSVKNTQKITRAMELIAASRIVKAQQRVKAAAPYAEMVHDVIKGLAVSNEVKDHPMVREHEAIRNVGLVVVTSDRGLAGAYNTNILRRAENIMKREEERGRNIKLYLIGRKGITYFQFRGYKPERTWTGITDQPRYADAQPIAEELMHGYASEQLDRVYYAYTDFKTAFLQEPTHMELLPVRPEEFEGGTEIPPEFMFEPGPDSILEFLVPRYVEAIVFNGLLESSASEHASRQRAMHSATENADEVIESLSRVMNQARQDQITTEISEIVGGAEALGRR
jgi:F-type H+-transporting ATPase subunit gamma